MYGLEIRPAKEEDLERLAEIHAFSYPHSDGLERHKRSFTHNAFGGLENVRVADMRGEIVGHAVLFQFELWLGGRRVPTGGIASLAVAPEVRRQGVARMMLDALHHQIEADQGALALLYPFRQDFYAGYGYAAVAPLLTLKVATEAFAKLPSFGADADAAKFSIARIEGSLLEQARELYEMVARTSSGRIARTDARWATLFSRETRYWMGVVSAAGRLEGYASFSYDGPAATKEQTLVVHELTAKAGPAKGALLHALGNQRDQVVDIELTIPDGDPLALAFEDAAGARRGAEPALQPLGMLSAGPMVRVVDVRRALGLRGYAAEGDLTVRCTDGAESQSVRVTVRGGTPEVGDGSGGLEVELSRRTLGSIVAAGLRPMQAAELGLLRASTAALRLAEDMFAGPRFQCLDPF